MNDQPPNEKPRRIGPYAIDRELGRGGMGVVYLGHDTRLDRAVAIKMMPEHLASDPERLGRFEREARVLASLHHPNIAGIHGVEEEGGARFLVLEFVEGASLSDRLDAGPLSVDDALEIAIQVAAGIEAAHEAGVVHRDLKPANVIVTPDGRAKVLDFGLARRDDTSTSSSSSPSVSGSESMTATTPANHSPTMSGVIMGTAAYMSPEQARGRRVDKRTDVWSFGVLLFEMLTGESPFRGETVSDSIGAVLHKDADLDALPAGTPPMVRHVLRRCLARDRDKRYRDIGDVRIELEAALADPESAAARGGAADGAGAVGPSRRPFPAALVLGVAVVALALGAGAAWLLRPSEPAVPAPPSVSFAKITDFAGVELHPALSPDGGTIAYVALDEDTGAPAIHSIRVGGFNPRRLSPNEPYADRAPAFSPDGSLIAFRSERSGGGIFVMGATGESPRRVTDFGHDPAWSPDGARLVFAEEEVLSPLARLSTSALWVVPIDGGEPEQIYEGDAVEPAWSPDGERIAFWTLREGGERDLYTMPATGGEPVAVTADAATDWNPAWSPEGRHLYFVSDRSGPMNVWRIPVDAETGGAAGPPESVTRGSGAWLGWISLSGDGSRIAFISQTFSSSLKRLRLNAGSEASGATTREPDRILGGSTILASIDVSPDGEWLAAQTSGREDIVLIRSDGSERRRLTDDPHRDRQPRFSSDGSTVLFYSDRSGEYAAWTIGVDGGNLQRLVPNGDLRMAAMTRWGPGERSVFAIDGTTAQTHVADLTVPAAERRWERFEPLIGEEGTLIPFGWSPDGSILALADPSRPDAPLVLHSAETGRLERAELDIPGLRSVDWLSEGPALLLLANDGWHRYDVSTGRTTLVRAMDLSPDIGGGFALAPGDDVVYFPAVEQEADVWVMDVSTGQGPR